MSDVERSNIDNEDLHRGLKDRQIQLIAIGGIIGVGLFLGSSSAMKVAGPGLILAYALGGIIMYIMMRALGEMAVHRPLAGSFSAYAAAYLGPRAGYLTGWTYWLVWVVTGMVEITAVGVFCTYWWPGLPQWIPALAALVAMTCVNLISVKYFGEFEFWFAMIKIITILALIACGIGIIFFGLGNGGIATGISNLYSLEGGFLPYGISGVAMSLTMVMFAFVGMELIGVAAGETADPEKSIPSAVNKVFYRVLIFYVGALFVIMSIFPWNEIGSSGSPFVLVFKQMGLDKAAAVINFVVLTSALSSCNSGIFSNGRMLYNLALQRRAPAYFAEVSRHKIPARAVLASSFVMLSGVLLNYFLPEEVFLILTSIAAFAGVWIWITIFVTHIKFRQQIGEKAKDLKYRAPLFPIVDYIGLAFMAFMFVILAIYPESRIAMIVGPIWIALLMVVYYAVGYAKQDREHSLRTRAAVGHA